MIQDQDSRAFPAEGSGTSATLTVYIEGRQAQGTGSYSWVGMPPSLAIVFPNGRDDMKTHSVLREVIITHILNYPPLVAWWSPKNATPEAALRATLGSWIQVTPYSGGMFIWFDGQFGPVLVS